MMHRTKRDYQPIVSLSLPFVFDMVYLDVARPTYYADLGIVYPLEIAGVFVVFWGFIPVVFFREHLKISPLIHISIPLVCSGLVYIVCKGRIVHTSLVHLDVDTLHNPFLA